MQNPNCEFLILQIELNKQRNYGGCIDNGPNGFSNFIGAPPCEQCQENSNFEQRTKIWKIVGWRKKPTPPHRQLRSKRLTEVHCAANWLQVTIFFSWSMCGLKGKLKLYCGKSVLFDVRTYVQSLHFDVKMFDVNEMSIGTAYSYPRMCYHLCQFIDRIIYTNNRFVFQTNYVLSHKNHFYANACTCGCVISRA